VSRRAALVVAAITLAASGTGCGAPATKRAHHTTRRPLALPDLVARVRSGVVRVEVETCSQSDVGTGFIISPGRIATVDHVVDGALSITLVRFGKVVGSATVIGADPQADLALLKTDAPLDGYRFSLANRAPRIGESVAALGYPLGLPLSVSTGAVSGADRTITIDGVKRRGLLQTDAPLNPGNSGGPLLEVGTGRVLGLVDARNANGAGLGFAVSIATARPPLQAWNLAPQPQPAESCT
jgi:S1-C subfamily serine protease